MSIHSASVLLIQLESRTRTMWPSCLMKTKQHSWNAGYPQKAGRGGPAAGRSAVRQLPAELCQLLLFSGTHPSWLLGKHQLQQHPPHTSPLPASCQLTGPATWFRSLTWPTLDPSLLGAISQHGLLDRALTVIQETWMPLADWVTLGKPLHFCASVSPSVK